MEERRLLLAVALSLLVLTAYQLLFPPAPAPPAASRPPAAMASPPPPATPTTASPTAAPLPSPPAVVSAVAPVADDKERRVEMEAPGLALVFTNKGARLLSWQLLEFKDSRGRPEEMVRMVADGPRPLDLETGDPSLDGRL